MKRVLYLLLIVLSVGRFAAAKKHVYETGKLIDVSAKYVEYPIQLGGGLIAQPQILIGYSFEIQVGELTYFVKANLTGPLKVDAKPEWTAGNPVELRFDKAKVFVRRPNGKELLARVESVVHGTPGRSRPLPSSGTDLQFPQPSEEVPGHKMVPLGMDLLRSDKKCLLLYGTVEAGDFFDRLKIRKTRKGVRFQERGEEVQNFPEALVVRVFAVLGACSAQQQSADRGAISANVQLDEDFLKSVSFDGRWKQGFAEQIAELGPVAEGRIRSPDPSHNDRDWWAYEFKVRSEGISLNNALVIVMHLPDGKMVARLSARLGSK